MNDASRPARRRWLQFNLTTLLLGILVVTTCLGLHTAAARRQREVRERIEAAGGLVWYGHLYDDNAVPDTNRASRVPAWALHAAGEDFFHNVAWVSLYNGRPTDDDVRAVASLDELVGLQLSGEAVTDEGLASLESLGQMRRLMLSCPKMTDASLSCLRGMPRLQELYVYGDIGDAGARQIAAAGGLSNLTINSQRLTDEGLAELLALRDLAILELWNCPVTDAGILRLAELPKLKILRVQGTRVTAAGVRALSQAKPGLGIDDGSFNRMRFGG